MEKPQATRHWKEVHRRNDSVDSFNDSMHSNRSSLSSGYNKFHFKKNDDGHKRSAIFRFTARNKDNPHDVSILTKQSAEGVETKQNRNDALTPRPFKTLDSMVKRMQSLEYDREKCPELKGIIIDIKSLVSSLKSTLDYFNRQMREIKFSWELAIRALQRKQIEFQNKTIADLKSALQAKQKEIQQLNKKNTFAERHIFVNGQGRKVEVASGGVVEGPIASLAISEVQLARFTENDNILSRNNTLNSLLGVDSKVTLFHSCKPQQELSLLRKTMSKMREMLEEPVDKFK